MSYLCASSSATGEVIKESDHSSQYSTDIRWFRRRRHLTILMISVLALTGIGLLRLAGNLSVQTTIGPENNLAQVVHTYMSVMANGDAEGAYDLFSTRSQQQLKLADVKKLLRGEGQMVFNGYQSSHVNHTDVRVLLSTDPTLPQGLTARLIGIIRYEDDLQGYFEAILELDNGQWRLHSIRVTGPADGRDSGAQTKEGPNSSLWRPPTIAVGTKPSCATIPTAAHATTLVRS